MKLLKQIAEKFKKIRNSSATSEDLELIENLSSNDEWTIEQAVCMLLVKLSLIDGEFEPIEHNFIRSKISKFGISEDEIEILIQQAKNLTTAFRGVHSFANVLNKEYSQYEKEKIAKTLKEIIILDGELEGFEQYLLNKILDILEVDSL